MGAQTREIRAVYRESAMFRYDVRGTRQLLSAFVFTAAISFAMLGGATSFAHNPAMQQWLRWAASVVMFLGCGGIGLRLIGDGLKELQQTNSAHLNHPKLPASLRPDRKQGLARVAVGAVLGVAVPLGIVIYSLL